MSDLKTSTEQSVRVARISNIPGIPLFQHNGDKPSNFSIIVETFTAAMISKHGDVANLLITGVEHSEAMIKRPDMTGDNASTSSFLSSGRAATFGVQE